RRQATRAAAKARGCMTPPPARPTAVGRACSSRPLLPAPPRWGGPPPSAPSWPPPYGGEGLFLATRHLGPHLFDLVARLVDGAAVVDDMVSAPLLLLDWHLRGDDRARPLARHAAALDQALELNVRRCVHEQHA